jgi:TrmH family RNA methyltransferase
MTSSEPLTTRSTRVKQARKLARRASRMSARRFLAEGPQAVREALAYAGPTGPCVREVFATADVEDRHRALRDAARAASVDWHVVDDEAIAALTDTVSPQGVVAVCDFLDVPLADALATRPDMVVICANIRDPGNAGTVIRCADAAGAGLVVLAGESVDPYNGKAVRASAGSLFHVPVVSGVTVTETVHAVREAGLVVLAADGAGDVDVDQLLDAGELERRTAWLFGNEAWGLPTALAELADTVVRLPIYGRAESLNLATAAAVCLYTSARAQRRAGR